MKKDLKKLREIDKDLIAWCWQLEAIASFLRKVQGVDCIGFEIKDSARKFADMIERELEGENTVKKDTQ